MSLPALEDVPQSPPAPAASPAVVRSNPAIPVRVPLSGVEIAGAAGRVELTFGPARGEVPINVSGRVDAFAVQVTEDVPVRVRAGAGADRLTLDGVTHTAVAAASRFASDGWDAAPDRYDVDTTVHLGTLTVEHR